jgi:hypothetical protein
MLLVLYQRGVGGGRERERGWRSLCIAPSLQPADSDFWRDRDQIVDVDDFRRVLRVVQHTLTT